MDANFFRVRPYRDVAVEDREGAVEGEKQFKLGDTVEIIGHEEWLRRLDECIENWKAVGDGDDSAKGIILQKVHRLGLKDGDFFRYLPRKKDRVA